MKKSSIILLVVIAAVAIFFAASQFMGGVRVTIRNTGEALMDNTTVHVTGRDYRLGDIEPGGQKSVKVQPVGESHVEVSFVGPGGQQQRVTVDCYFEGKNYSGTIVIHIADGKLVHMEDSVSIGISF